MKEDIKEIGASVKRGDLKKAAEQTVEVILNVGISGTGPFKGAEALAAEVQAKCVDNDEAVRRVIRMHRRLVSASGFATGLGGLTTLPVAIPTDVTIFYTQAVRMVGAIAHVRGYDVRSDEVRSVILISLIGVLGAETLSKLGIEVAGKVSVAALKKLPGRVLIKINQKVGFRLVTKFGEKGVVNLWKVVPGVSGGVGAGINALGITAIASHAKANFPAINSDEDAGAHL